MQTLPRPNKHNRRENVQSALGVEAIRISYQGDHN
jgi:hypothetical protein